ncbi:MAG TPA: pyruvate kinase, partial [Steroidobacteraceae bacterium]|nr:pyruvate kinase [Steroidobacteraceae bacterium]
AHREGLAAVAPRYRNSARNLLHYLSLRQHDIRPLQQDLHSLGLSSIGIAEAHVLATLNAVTTCLEALAGQPPSEEPNPPADFQSGPLLLRDHARRLFGALPAARSVRIMVTMPSEAAEDPHLIESLLRSGMDIMRINCAHDGPPAWRRMVAHLRRAEKVVGRTCRVQADLAGPKLRTGPIEPAGQVCKLKPRRDPLGRPLAPVRVWFTPQSAPESAPEGATTVVPLAAADGAWRRARSLQLKDLRGRRRSMRVVAISDRSVLAELDRTAYLGRGTLIEARDTRGTCGYLHVGELPPLVLPLRLATGDTLVLTREETAGRPAGTDPDTGRHRPAHIHCTLPAAFERVRPGERVSLDDGKIGGTVRRCDSGTIEIEITQSPPGGASLRAEKGINFPDTELGLDALTAKDLEDLREVAGLVDLIALSFLRSEQDVARLQQELRSLGAGPLGIVLKIENVAAFRNLPRILLASLTGPPLGVMVARGDLAVEAGFERLSEVQEEILWLCEAAHVPVIWATQVLEGLAKAGAPTRAEVSDAVMSSRAECVMLNKGPRIVETVAFLADVLERMATHHDKRMALLRRLSVSEL